jgi:hypothetical protein
MGRVSLPYCSECGQLLSLEERFCTNCGRSTVRPAQTVKVADSAVAPPPSNPSRHSGRRISTITIIVVAVVAGATIALVEAVPRIFQPAPAFLWVIPTRYALPFSGGIVDVSAKVRDATSCEMRLVTRQQYVPVTFSSGPVSCADNRFSRQIDFGTNVVQRTVVVTFDLFARRGSGKPHASHQFSVIVDPAISQPSSNWAGYVAGSAKPLTAVSGTWTIPMMHCATGNGALAAWVGVDGRPELGNTFQSNNNLLQAGSESVCSDGQQNDFMWWEWYPVNLSNPVLEVNPGDVVTALVVHASLKGQFGWWWYLEDVTTGQSMAAQAPVDYDGPATTADFVVEDPGVFGVGNANQPFVGFSPVTFSKMLLTTNTPPSYQPYSFGIFDPTDVVNMVHQVHGSLRTLAHGSLPSETGNGYGTMTVNYEGP